MGSRSKKEDKKRAVGVGRRSRVRGGGEESRCRAEKRRGTEGG